jgi:soluble lytic murein transglycosylase-like protein
MGPLTLAILLSAVSTHVPRRSDPIEDWRPIIEEASQRFQLPAAWIERVMRAESGGYADVKGQPVISRAGAIGLMQLMPATWAAMRTAYRLGGNVFDPHDNIIAGAAYLRLMFDRFGYPGLFGAYNAGPARWGRYLAHRSSIPDETRLYLAKVAVEKRETRGVNRSGTPTLFVIAHSGEAGRFDGSPSRPLLFAILRDR